LDLTHKVADKVLFLESGRISFLGPTADFFQSRDPNIQRYINMVNT
jgi:ABC-type transporter Mla maintaining outer membrane lipid asymmetry ATPase subunit MlaF